MDIHYNAFISYRHHPDDIKVASEIHRGLERFKIPKALKKRNIGSLRLFRDKEELPITSSLTDDIYRALENSDYLIVICSPHTRESIWVQREIETFLQTHTRDRVLTVLADGEPYDVLPEILLHEDVVNPVTGEIQHKDYEPLSCDWRLKKHQAVREELPRLAAPLLGCGYDELRQRQRQYRMRRLTTLFSAALIASLSLTAYFIHTSIRIQKANDDLHAANEQILEANVKIQENLEQALRNQSEYLAAAASERMEAGDRLTAISLALAALPSEDNDRPYVPEAERALSDALSSYESTDHVIAQGAFTTDALVKRFIVSDDGTQIVILDARTVLTVWDTVTFRKLSTIDLSAYSVDEISYTGSGNILIAAANDSGMLLCYRSDGTFLWQAEHCTDMMYLDDRSKILMLQNDYAELRQFTIIDADSGNPAGVSIPITPQEMDSSPSEFLQTDSVSDCPILVRYFSGTTHLLYLLDLHTGTLRKVTQMDTSFSGDRQSLDCAAVDASGNIILMRGDGSGMYNGNYGTFQVTSPDRADLICYDGRTLQVKWKSEIITYLYSYSSTIQPIPGSDRLLIQSGDSLQIHDGTTGKKLAQCQLPAIPLHLTVDAESAWGITQNGAYFSYQYGENQCYVTPFSDSTLDGAIVKGGYFVHVPLETQITVYRSMKDTEGAVYDENVSSSLGSGCVNNNHLLHWSNSILYMFDTESKKLLWQQELGYGWDMLGFSEDGTKVWMLNHSANCAAQFSVRDGTREDIPLTFAVDGLAAILESDIFFDSDSLLFLMEADGLMQLQRINLNSGRMDLCLDLDELSQEISDFRKTTEFILAFDHYAWIHHKESVYLIDLHTGSLRQILKEIADKPACVRNESGTQILAACGSELMLIGSDGDITLRIDLGDKKGVSVYFYKDQLLTLCDDGAVYRYDRQGNLLSKTPLELYNSFFSNVSGSFSNSSNPDWWVTDDGDLIINAFQAGNIIDCGQWQCRAFVPHLYAYIQQQDEILCFTDYQFFAYPRYTTLQQMRKAQDALGDFRLTEDQLKSYGLS